MASTLIDLASNFQLPTVAAQVSNALATTGNTLQVLAFTLTNTSGATRTVNLYRVAGGGAANAANQVVSGRTIATGNSYNVVELIGQVLEPGDSIWGDADAATSVSVAASGVVYTDE
jgi:hypothetical protein